MGMRAALTLLLLVFTATTALAEPQVRTERRRSRVVAAWALVGIGGASLATSLTLGYTADRRYEEAFADHCEEQNGVRICDPVGYSRTQRAISLGRVATGFAVAGWSLVAAAAIVYFTAPKDTVVVAPTVTADGGGLVVGRQF